MMAQSSIMIEHDQEWRSTRSIEAGDDELIDIGKIDLIEKYKRIFLLCQMTSDANHHDNDWLKLIYIQYIESLKDTHKFMVRFLDSP
jgi:hypothetical protein